MKVGIVGLGQIGGSIALSLKKDGRYEVCGMDLNKSLLEDISSHIDATVNDLSELKKSVEFVILATPINTIKKLLKEFKGFDGIVMDTGSTKLEIIEAARKSRIKFVGGHPLAGTEKRGQEGWKSDLFVGSKFFLSGNLRRRDKLVVEEVVKAIGAKPIWIEPDIHDLVMAYTSHMPYVIALVLTKLSSQYKDFWGPGIRSTTRIAAQDPGMAFDILMTNRKNIENALQDFSNILMELKILMRNQEELRDFLEKIAEIREKIDT